MNPNTIPESLRVLPYALVITVLFYFVSAASADYFLYHEFEQFLTFLLITALVSVIGIYRRKRTHNESIGNATKGYLKSLFISFLVLGMMLFSLAFFAML